MTSGKKATWHFEYSWRRTRILIAAALCAVMVWRVVLLPILRYLERNTGRVSADIFNESGYFTLHLDHVGLLALMTAVACIFASSKTEEEHRSNPIAVAFGVLATVILNVVFNSFGGLAFALVVALSLVPVVFLTSCLVVRDVSKLGNGIAYGLLFVVLILVSFGYYTDKEVAHNRLEYTMARAIYGVEYSHYYAERGPERMYEETVHAFAGAPLPRELRDWQAVLSNGDPSWGHVVDSGAGDDFLDFAYRTIGAADGTPVKIFKLSDDSAKDVLDVDVQGLSDATLRNLWMVKVTDPGMDKNAYVVTEQQILRCLTRVVSPPDKRRGIVFMNRMPWSDIELDSELLHCFDGQSMVRFQESTVVNVFESPCSPLHGFGNYSADKVDVLVAFMMRLWDAEGVDLRDAARHFSIHGLDDEAKEQLLVQLAAAEKHYAQGEGAQGEVAVSDAIELLQGVVLGAEMNADKRAFLTSLFASYHARKAGDESLAGEHDAACLKHRAQWYEHDPQAGLRSRTATATGSVVTNTKVGNLPLVLTMGMTGEALKPITKDWSEMGFWLRKLEHDQELIDQASVHFGVILDSFVSTRNELAEYEHVGGLFAKHGDQTFYTLQEEGLDITRYFVGSKHNGWCTYRLSLQAGDLSAASLQSFPRYCRVDDVLLSFDEKGQPVKRWDAAGLPFHAPVVIGGAVRLSGLSAAHREQIKSEDARDALLRLFLDQLTAGELEQVDSLNLDLHPGAHSLREDQRVVMERMRLGGEDLN